MSSSFAFIFLNVVLAIPFYDTCCQSGEKYISLEKWRDDLGIEANTIRTSLMETPAGDSYFRDYHGENEEVYYLYIEKNEEENNLLKCPQKLIVKLTHLISLVTVQNHPDYIVSCYANEEAYYIIFAGRQSTHNLEAVAVAQMTLLTRLQLYRSVLSYMKMLLEKNIVLGNFGVRDIIFLGANPENVLIIAFHEVMYVEEAFLRKTKTSQYCKTIEQLHEYIRMTRGLSQGESSTLPLQRPGDFRLRAQELLTAQNILWLMRTLEVKPSISRSAQQPERSKLDPRHVEFRDFLDDNPGFTDETTPSLEKIANKLRKLHISVERIPAATLKTESTMIMTPGRQRKRDSTSSDEFRPHQI